MRSVLLIALVVATGTATHANATDIKSISRIEFGPANTLPIADWPASTIDALALPSFEEPVAWGNITGVNVTYLPFSGVTRIDDLDDKYLLAVRQDSEEGTTQLVTFDKDIRLRVTDFVSEYDFRDYKYPKGYQSDFIKPIEDKLIREEGAQSPNKP